MSKEKAESGPGWLRALGNDSLPEQIELSSGTYRLERVFKHDFFAATACYRGADRKVILKIGRRAPFLGIPLGWIGRLLARHESAAYAAVADLEVVPSFEGRFGRHGILHEYVEGHALHKGEQVPDEFFERLRTGLQSIHARGMAYVDLEKCENVLVGDDGRPYLVDFQIAWRWPRRSGGDLWPVRWLRGRLQQADMYHLLKLQRRTRPDQLSEEQIRASYQRPWYIRVHGRLTRPFTLLRRRILQRWDPRRRPGERGRVGEE